jgi:hypothetical protein
MAKGAISGYKMPGISSMSRTEAETWIGKSVHYSIESAGVAGEICGSPTFQMRKVSRLEFYESFKIFPDDLDIDDGEVDLLEIGCPDNWTAPGSLLILGSDKLYMIWEGVYFLIEE